MMTPILPFREGIDFTREDSGCWRWLRYITPKGYGVLYYNKKMQRAHRVSWQIYRGPIPVGLCVCHSCDNPACVNPNHLWVGTQRDNMRDAAHKDRMSGPKPDRPYQQGENNKDAKLNRYTISVIRKASAKGLSWRDLAAIFGVSHTTIGDILRGRSWKNA